MPDIGSIPTVTSGQVGQHSHWNFMAAKVQDLTQGHLHDGVGSFGPLVNFSAAQFTNLSANALFVGSTIQGFGPVTFSGNLAAINYSGGGTLTAGGNASFGGTVAVTSGFTAGVINAPGNLSSSGIVSQLVAGSNITISGAGGTGVVAVGVGGTAVFAGTNQSLGTLVFGSALGQNTFTVSGQTALAALTVTNISNAGSEFLQSRLTANDAVFTNNISAGTGFISSSFTVGGPVNFSTGLQITNVSSNTEVIGSSQIGTLTLTSAEIISNANTSAGNFRFFQLSQGRTYQTLNATNASAVPDVSGRPGFLAFYDNVTAASATFGLQMTPTSGVVNTLVTVDSSGMKLFGNLSATGSLQLQSRMLANDAVVTGNLSAGSLYAGSSILLNYSANVGIIVSAQIATLTNLSLFINNPVNTSVGSFRIFTTSAGRAVVNLNAQPSGTADIVSGVSQWQVIFDQLSATPPQMLIQLGSSGTFNTPFTLTSAGLQIPNNLSTGSLVFGSGMATNLSVNTIVTGSAQIANLMNLSTFIIPNLSTNQSAGNYRLFSLSTGRTYQTLNTTNVSAIPDVSGNPMLLTYMDNLSATPAQYGWQIAPSSGTINTVVVIQSGLLAVTGGITLTQNLSHGAGVNYQIRTVTASTNTSSNDWMVLVNQSSVNEAVSLARAASSLGQYLTITTQSGAGTVTVFATSNDQIGFGGNVSSITLGGGVTSAVTRLIAYNQSTWVQV